MRILLFAALLTPILYESYIDYGGTAITSILIEVIKKSSLYKMLFSLHFDLNWLPTKRMCSQIVSLRARLSRRKSRVNSY